MTSNYDAIIIGTGQAGPSLAVRLAGAGMQVAIIERGRFGGAASTAADRAHGTPDAHWPRRADAHAPRISVDARGSEVPSAASSRISLSSVRLAIARFSRAFSVSNSFR